MLSRRIKIQLAVFVVVSVAAITILGFVYIHAPSRWFGVGQYGVTVQLPESGNLYQGGNVTYRGTEVGRVTAVNLTEHGVEAELSLNSDVRIPSDLDAEVHSHTAIGEQYVALLPRDGTAPPLKNGDVIAASRSSVPPDMGSLLDAVNRGVQAIPRDDLRTVIDESYKAFGGLGPEISRMVENGTTLATDARSNLDALTALVDGAAPVLDSQADTSDAVQQWAAHLASITEQVHTHDSALAGVLDEGGPAADEVQQLFEQLKPTLPIVLRNLVSVGEVAVVYQDAIEQLLVLLPQGVAQMQGIGVAGLNTKQDRSGLNMNFNLNLNAPPPCTTGFLPAQQRRAFSLEDTPPRPPGLLYCRIPQDAKYRNVRGARNLPCVTVPGKRAPTVEMCESDEEYVPLNEGYNWKGDPNATLTGQDVPQLPAESEGASPDAPEQPAAQGASAPSALPIPAVEYDPATGTYVGPDGNVYAQADLARNGDVEPTWQDMLFPPTAN